MDCDYIFVNAPPIMRSGGGGGGVRPPSGPLFSAFSHKILVSGIVMLTIVFIITTVALTMRLASPNTRVRPDPPPGPTTTATTISTSSTSSTSSSTSSTSGTSTSTGITTTAPAVPINLTCPSDVVVVLGASLDPALMMGGPATAVGGCGNPATPIVAYTDVIVSTSLAKRSRKRMMSAALPPRVTDHSFRQGVSLNGDCSTWAEQPTAAAIELLSWGKKRSPSFPDTHLVQQSTYSTLGTAAVVRPDTALAVGVTHVVHAVNDINGTRVLVSADKSDLGGSLSEFMLHTLAGGVANCTGPATGGEGQVIWDYVAQQWVLSEMGQPGTQSLCIYVSDGPDPLSASYRAFSYYFADGDPVFHKLAVWGVGVYAITLGRIDVQTTSLCVLDRQAMLEASMTTPSVNDTAPVLFCGAPFDGPLPGFTGSPAAQSWSPVHAVGDAPPVETEVSSAVMSGDGGAVFMRAVDDELHFGAATPKTDELAVEHWYGINFTLSIYGVIRYQLNVGDFRANAGTIPTPTVWSLDPVREPLMPRLVYRYIPETGQQSVVGALTSHADMGARYVWFELRWIVPVPNTNPLWVLHQQGVHNYTDGLQTWLPSATMDANGTMALTYAAGNATTYPSLYAASRLGNDPEGELRDPLLLYAGTIGSTLESGEWGRSSAMEPDPEDARTFYAGGPVATVAGPWESTVTRLRVLGETIERNWTAFDYCGTQETCLQIILAE